MTTTTQTEEQKAVTIVLAHKIASLGLNATFVEPISVGPILSVYRFMPKGSTKVSSLEALSQDFALALGVEDVMVKRMPGEVAVGIFVPNKERKYVQWRDICGVPPNRAIIPLVMGVDHLGNKVLEDLTLFPHLLVAGSTGGGKSTFLNSLIATWIYNNSPDDIQIILIDLKQVEFNHFVGARHLLFEPAYNVYQALERMQWAIDEMEGRLKKFAKCGARNILEYNNRIQTSTGSTDTSRTRTSVALQANAKIAYIVIVFDELASLLLDSRKEGENEGETRGPSLGKIAQGKLSQLAEKARATGIHIIAATQRSSVKVVEGNIKANFPARLTFRLPSEADSRTILGTSGAEHLLSRGDMLFSNPNRPGLARIHAPLASIQDIKAAVEYSTRRQQ
jgi:S-DNA-T family DNA segregation ATPase FtsK/SpoIIIE